MIFRPVTPERWTDFERGFVEVGRAGLRRHVMRRELRGTHIG